MGTQVTVSTEQQIQILKDMHEQDQIHGKNREQLASSLQTRALSQAVRYELYGLGYKSSYRDILQFDDDGTALMAQKMTRVNHEDGTTEVVAAVDADGQPVMEQVTRSIEHFVTEGVEFQPENAKASRGSGRGGASVMTDASWKKLDKATVPGMLLDDIEKELGHQIVTSDIRAIEQRYRVYTGWKTIGHADYKMFKPIKD